MTELYRVGLVEYEVDPDSGRYEAREPVLGEEAARVYMALLDFYASRGWRPGGEGSWLAADRLGLRDEYERFKAAIDYWLHRSIEGWGPLHPFLIDGNVDAVSVRSLGTAVRWRGRWLRARPEVALEDARRLVDALAVAPLGSVRMLSGGLRARVAPGEVLVWRPPRPGGDPSLAALAAMALLEGESVLIEGPGADRLASLVLELLRGEGVRLVAVDPHLRVAPDWVSLAEGDPSSMLPDIVVVVGGELAAREQSLEAPVLYVSPSRRARGGWEDVRISLWQGRRDIVEEWLARHPGRERELRRLEARALEVAGHG